jgi:hypothetical protein
MLHHSTNSNLLNSTLLFKLIGNAVRNMTSSHMFTGGAAVNLLIVKEHIGAEGLKKVSFAEAAKK